MSHFYLPDKNCGPPVLLKVLGNRHLYFLDKYIGTVFWEKNLEIRIRILSVSFDPPFLLLEMHPIDLPKCLLSILL